MTDWLNPLATLFASFAGAWAAFKLHTKETKVHLTRSQIAAVNRAFFTMLQQANTLKVFQRDQIEPHRNSRGRMFEIRPTLPYDLGTLRFDLQSLDFFDSSNEREIIFELWIEERRFEETLRAINARSEMILTQVDPKFVAAGLLDGASYRNVDVELAIGQPLFNKVNRLTDDVIYHVDTTSALIVGMKTKMLGIAKARFPDASFLNFEFPESQPTVGGSTRPPS